MQNPHLRQHARADSCDRSAQRTEDCIKDIVDRLRQSRDFSWKRLNEIEGISTTKPEGAFYIFPKIQGIGTTMENRHGLRRATAKRNRRAHRQRLRLRPSLRQRTRTHSFPAANSRAGAAYNALEAFMKKSKNHNRAFLIHQL